MLAHSVSYCPKMHRHFQEPDGLHNLRSNLILLVVRGLVTNAVGTKRCGRVYGEETVLLFQLRHGRLSGIRRIRQLGRTPLNPLINAFAGGGYNADGKEHQSRPSHK